MQLTARKAGPPERVSMRSPIAGPAVIQCQNFRNHLITAVPENFRLFAVQDIGNDDKPIAAKQIDG